MTAEGTTSATPILDLLAPLPKPQTWNSALGEYLFPTLLIMTVFVSRNYQLLIPIFGFWIIALLTIAIHELGHVMAGCGVGFCFQSVGIGPIWIKRESNRWTVKLRRGLLDGATFMSLDRIHRVRRRLIIFSASGPAAGLLAGVIGFVCLRLAIDRDDAFLSLILACFAGYSIFANLVSLVPTLYRGYGNDGKRLKVLLCSKEGARQVLATYALGMQQRKGIEPFCLNSRWIQVASSPGNVVVDPRHSACTADLNAYQNAASTELAAQFLERCLANSAFLTAENRDALVVEAAIFTAWQRNDAKKAETWFKRAANPGRIHPLIRSRVEAALSCACGRFDDALQQLEGGLGIIRQLSPFGARERLEVAWLKLCREIEVRRES